jgi:hypothetical protein
MQIAPVAAQRVLSTEPTTPVDPPKPPPPAGFDHVFDFPTLAAGQKFKVASGSTFNGIGVGGDARLDALTPKSAKVWIKAGTFFLKKEALLTLEQTSPTAGTFTVAEPSGSTKTINGTIVDVKTNYSEFTSADPAIQGGAKLQVDAAGKFIVDVEGAVLASLFPGLAIDAKIHLVLEKTA